MIFSPGTPTIVVAHVAKFSEFSQKFLNFMEKILTSLSKSTQEINTLSGQWSAPNEGDYFNPLVEFEWVNIAKQIDSPKESEIKSLSTCRTLYWTSTWRSCIQCALFVVLTRSLTPRKCKTDSPWAPEKTDIFGCLRFLLNNQQRAFQIARSMRQRMFQKMLNRNMCRKLRRAWLGRQLLDEPSSGDAGN